MRPVDRILERLERPKGNFPSWNARCPAHVDSTPSLHITAKDDGRVLLHCHAGCDVTDVLAAIGLSLTDLFAESLGELSGKKHREPESVLYDGGYRHMRDEIESLRARLKR